MASLRRCRRKFRVLVDGSGAETADYFGIKKGEFVGEASEEGGKRGWSGIERGWKMEGIVESSQANQLQRTGLPMDGFGVLDEKKRRFLQQELN
jgi:hypothetical protein